MPAKEIKDIKIPYAAGPWRILRTFEFVAARPVANGVLEITIRERRFLFLVSAPRTYCGAGSLWRDSAGRTPPLAEAFYLCQCWMALAKHVQKAKVRQHFENPLRR